MLLWLTVSNDSRYRGMGDLEFSLLFLLNTTDSMANLQTSKILDKEPASTSRALTSLIKKGYVVKRDAHRFQITNAGEKVIDEKIEKSPLHNEINKAFNDFRSNPHNRYLFATFTFGVLSWVGFTTREIYADAVTSTTSTTTAATATGAGTSKSLIAVIVVTVISTIGGGIYAGDAYFSDLFVE